MSPHCAPFYFYIYKAHCIHKASRSLVVQGLTEVIPTKRHFLPKQGDKSK